MQKDTISCSVFGHLGEGGEVGVEDGVAVGFWFPFFFS